MPSTKYKIYSTVVPETKFVKEEELQEYLDGHWKLAGETTTTSFGANVMTESDTESEELTTTTDEEGNEVAELGATDERPLELSKAPETMNIDPDSPQAETWLTDVEREKLRQASDSEQLEYDEMMAELEEDCQAVEEELRQERRRETTEKLAERYKPQWMDTPVSDMTGEQFAKALNSGPPEEIEAELQAEIAEAESEFEVEEAEEDTEVDPEVLEEGAASFSEKGGVWEDISQDIRAEELGGVDSVRFGDFGDDTDITLKDSGDDKLAEISTESAELQEEIRAVAEETDATILKDTGDKMLAEVSESDVERFNS